MTTTDRTGLLAKLEAGRTELLASIDGLSDAEAGMKPSEDRWSAIGNIEHLAIVEAHLLGRIREASVIEGESVPGREAAIFELVRIRTTKLSAPPQAHPTGACATLVAAMEKFDRARSQTVAFVESCDYDLRLRSTTHPLLGPLTGLECIHTIAGHAFRHAAQIRELRAR